MERQIEMPDNRKTSRSHGGRRCTLSHPQEGLQSTEQVTKKKNINWKGKLINLEIWANKSFACHWPVRQIVDLGTVSYDQERTDPGKLVKYVVLGAIRVHLFPSSWNFN